MTPDASLPPADVHFREPWDLRLHDADAAQCYCQGRNPNPLPSADVPTFEDQPIADQLEQKTGYGYRPPADVQRPEPPREKDEGCTCGHGQYNHGAGYTLLGRLVGEHSRCIRCDCMEFKWADR